VNRGAIESHSDAEIDPETLERDDAIIGVALRWSLGVFVVATVLAGAAVYYFRPTAPLKPVQESALAEVQLRATPEVTIPYVRFTDVTDAAGIHFRHRNAANGHKLLPETMGGGCAFFDFDGDGDQDLLFVNSEAHWPWDEQEQRGRDSFATGGQNEEAMASSRKRVPTPSVATMALYRNDGQGNFADVTAGSGRASHGRVAAIMTMMGDRHFSFRRRRESTVPQRRQWEVS
jgi:hypothetical protein